MEKLFISITLIMLLSCNINNKNTDNHLSDHDQIKVLKTNLKAHLKKSSIFSFAANEKTIVFKEKHSYYSFTLFKDTKSIESLKYNIENDKSFLFSDNLGNIHIAKLYLSYEPALFCDSFADYVLNRDSFYFSKMYYNSKKGNTIFEKWDYPIFQYKRNDKDIFIDWVNEENIFTSDNTIIRGVLFFRGDTNVKKMYKNDSIWLSFNNTDTIAFSNKKLFKNSLKRKCNVKFVMNNNNLLLVKYNNRGVEIYGINREMDEEGCLYKRIESNGVCNISLYEKGLVWLTNDYILYQVIIP